MTNEQLYFAIGVPLLFNTVVSVTIYALLSGRLTALQAQVNTRFDDMRELWRAELRRVEEVLDARLKHIEEQRR